MIAHKGRLSFKQYLPVKPTIFGIKVWERESPRYGYCHEFHIYTGKVDREKSEEGLGERVVKDSTRKIVNKGHHINMDNFFRHQSFFPICIKKSTAVEPSREIGKACQRVFVIVN
jgi:hypothetical protein